MADFEKQLTALESVVERLEQGDLSLEESVRLFELVDRGKSGMKAVDLDVKEDVAVGEDEE